MSWIKNFGFKVELTGIYALAAVSALFAAITIVFSQGNIATVLAGIIFFICAFLLGIFGLAYDKADELQKISVFGLVLITVICSIGLLVVLSVSLLSLQVSP